MDQYRNKIIDFQQMVQKRGYFFVFDLETTGIPNKDPIVNIIEFSAIKIGIKDGKLQEIDSLDLFINPGYLIPENITKLTGITQEYIDEYGISEDEACKKIQDFLKENPLLCGYNSISFDEPLLSELYQRVLNRSFWSSRHLDVMRMAKEKLAVNPKKNRKDTEIKNYKLKTVTEFFKVDEGLSFHKSIDDVKATYRVMKKLMNMYKEKEKTDEPNLSINGFYITHIGQWKKSYQMNRIYVKNNIDAKIYYDLYKKMWYIGNNLPEEEILREVFKKAKVRNTTAFVKKYEKTY